MNCFYALLLACSFLMGCGTQPIKGSGTLAKKEINVSDFNGVHLKVPLRLAVEVNHKGPLPQVLEMASDDNIVEHIRAVVKDGTLNVDFNTDAKIFSKMGVGLSTTANEVKEVRLEKMSKLILKGKAMSLTLSLGFKSAFLGESYQTKSVHVELEPLARASVCATEKISGKVAKGAVLIVSCGGDFGSVSVEDGGEIRLLDEP